MQTPWAVIHLVPDNGRPMGLLRCRAGNIEWLSSYDWCRTTNNQWDWCVAGAIATKIVGGQIEAAVLAIGDRVTFVGPDEIRDSLRLGKSLDGSVVATSGEASHVLFDAIDRTETLEGMPIGSVWVNNHQLRVGQQATPCTVDWDCRAPHLCTDFGAASSPTALIGANQCAPSERGHRCRCTAPGGLPPTTATTTKPLFDDKMCGPSTSYLRCVGIDVMCCGETCCNTTLGICNSGACVLKKPNCGSFYCDPALSSCCGTLPQNHCCDKDVRSASANNSNNVFHGCSEYYKGTSLDRCTTCAQQCSQYCAGSVLTADCMQVSAFDACHSNCMPRVA